MEKLYEVEIMGEKLDLFIEGDERYFLAGQIAEMVGYSLANVSKLVSRVDDDEKKKAVHTERMSRSSGGKHKWFLTESGMREALFLCEKPIAKEFKREVKRILKEIDRSGIYIATERDDLWRSTRKESKVVRLGETNMIKEFVAYAKSMGSTKPNWYYKHFTVLVNKKLNIPEGTKRDDMDKKTLMAMNCYENMIALKLEKKLNGSEDYKEIYREIKNTIENF